MRGQLQLPQPHQGEKTPSPPPFPRVVPLYYGGTLCKLCPGGWRVSVKWQQLGLVVVLLGTGGLVGLQEKSREGVDLVRPPNLMGQQWQLHNVEIFI